MGPREFGAFARENGILFYQAHPFRNGITVVPPEALFGIEVLNTHPRHDSRNDIALAWAEKYGLHKIAGSDCHQTCDVGTSAIVTDETVRSVEDLVYVLKNDLFSFGTNER
jgi:predicted metal-dependent phosphoesterase TrpH